MRVIPPLEINTARFTSSTASEPLSPSAYAGGTTYVVGNIVYVTADHLIYQSLVSSNLGNTPSVSPSYWSIVGYIETAYNAGTTYALDDTISYNHRIYQSIQASNLAHQPDTSSTWWEDVGATNKYRCFDILRNTGTVQASPLTIVLTPGLRINSVALLGVIADSIAVSMTSVAGGGTVYNETFNLSTRFIGDWYDYFFAEFTFKTAAVVFELPPYSDGIVTVSLTRATGNITLGSLVIGSFVDLGKAQYNAESDALNFSTIERDNFGNSVLIPRRTIPKTVQQVRAEAGNTNKIRDVRDALNAVPAIWSGLDDNDADFFEALLILGIYKRFTIDLATPSKVISTIELEEV